MKRKIVQHGPSTLTISIPADWVREHGVQKGDEISVERVNQGLLLTTEKGMRLKQKTISVKGIQNVIAQAVAALYKRGYDEIVIQYSKPEELETLHTLLNKGYIGFEIVHETKNEVYIRNVTEPSKEEFKTLFRRIFYFLLAISQDSVKSAQDHKNGSYQRLILLNDNITRLTDFCRRMVTKHGQNLYVSDAAIYHIIEQLEKIGNTYTEVNKLLLDRKKMPSRTFVKLYESVNTYLRSYEELFFRFTLARADLFVTEFNDLHQELHAELVQTNGDDVTLIHLLQQIVKQIHNLSDTTMVLHL